MAVVAAAVAGAAHLAQGALEGLDLAFVVDFLALGQFQSLEHFVHFIERAFQLLDNLGDVVDGFGERRAGGPGLRFRFPNRSGFAGWARFARSVRLTHLVFVFCLVRCLVPVFVFTVAVVTFLLVFLLVLVWCGLGFGRGVAGRGIGIGFGGSVGRRGFARRLISSAAVAPSTAASTAAFAWRAGLSGRLRFGRLLVFWGHHARIHIAGIGLKCNPKGEYTSQLKRTLVAWPLYDKVWAVVGGVKEKPAGLSFVTITTLKVRVLSIPAKPPKRSPIVSVLCASSQCIGMFA